MALSSAEVARAAPPPKKPHFSLFHPAASPIAAGKPSGSRRCRRHQSTPPSASCRCRSREVPLPVQKRFVLSRRRLGGHRRPAVGQRRRPSELCVERGMSSGAVGAGRSAKQGAHLSPETRRCRRLPAGFSARSESAGRADHRRPRRPPQAVGSPGAQPDKAVRKRGVGAPSGGARRALFVPTSSTVSIAQPVVDNSRQPCTERNRCVVPSAPVQRKCAVEARGALVVARRTGRPNEASGPGLVGCRPAGCSGEPRRKPRPGRPAVNSACRGQSIEGNDAQNSARPVGAGAQRAPGESRGPTGSWRPGSARGGRRRCVFSWTPAAGGPARRPVVGPAASTAAGGWQCRPRRTRAGISMTGAPQTVC